MGSWPLANLNMKSLRELVVEKKSRKGPAAGTTKHGAFWIAYETEIGRMGGDGIGQSSPDITTNLVLRHYRDDAVRAMVEVKIWHQNQGDHTAYESAAGVLSCESVEDVIIALKQLSLDSLRDLSPLTSSKIYRITKELVEFGLVESLPSPDET